MPQDPLNLVCIEPRFPGRLGPVADWLVRHRGYRCRFYFNSADPREFWPESVGRGLDLIQFNVGGVARETSVHWTRQLERGLCYAYGCWEVLEAQRTRPIDLVVGRSNGLGSTLFVPVYLPNAATINLFDYYYHPHANDLADDSPAETSPEYFQWRRSASAMDLLDLENGVVPWTLSQWQRSLFPAEYQPDFRVMFDGINTERFNRVPGRARTIGGRSIPDGMRIVSFVARNLDRTRGFDRFVLLANQLLEARPDVLCIAAGDPVVQRGLDVQFYGRDYAAHLLTETPAYDRDRFWQLGAVGPGVVSELLGMSDLHIYPSRRYVTARSLYEAMSAGCVVLASDDEPVRELISDRTTGLLVERDDAAAWEQIALEVLAAPNQFRPIGDAAADWIRETVSREVCMPQLAEMFQSCARVPGK